ncbi:MAG: hypothetical protein ACPG5M_06740 [Winogradskyella sp.]
MGADFCSKSSLKSNLVKEYNTTSVPDINAEQTRSTKKHNYTCKKKALTNTTFTTKTVGSEYKMSWY